MTMKPLNVSYPPFNHSKDTMASYDLWFCRYEGELWAVAAPPEEPPTGHPRRAGNVSSVVGQLKFTGHQIAQIGILPPDMMGLE